MRISSRADSHRDEPEKPFWISYSDLMTALMILFLVVMVVSLTSLTQQTQKVKIELEKKIEPPKELTVKNKDQEIKKIAGSDLTSLELSRQMQISHFCKELDQKIKENKIKVTVNCRYNKIELGEVAGYESGKYQLGQDGKKALSKLVPIILKMQSSVDGKKWLKRISIQGYTDTDGSYLYNLDLSLKRSEWVMCHILGATNDKKDIPELSDAQRDLVKSLFIVGGVSFNDARSSKEASRRVDFQMEFRNLKAELADTPAQSGAKQDVTVSDKCQI